ncbi:MAG: NAD(P)-dependent oxidoreductase [Spirochaetaceae bacterium]|nr:MAG: NAD(P)-dependent oxidoreductase [Spirochaetaceae bacterium]
MINRSSPIGFIGLGVMGKSMADHLLAAGHPLHVYNRTRSKADDLVAKGAIWHDTVAEVARASTVVCTIVGFPSDVEEVYLGPNGILENIASGSIVIDLTTSKPMLAQRLADTARARGVGALDAPVSGGDRGAREAKLSIMVGGDRVDFESSQPVLSLMGNPVYQGPAGSGQHTKMCNQIAVAGTMLGVCESLAYAVRSGLDPKTVLQSIEHGAAASWALSVLSPRILSGDFAPGFFIKHFIKDMGIAIESAEEMGLSLPALSLAKSLYEQLAADGKGDLGTQALFTLLAGS